MPWHGLAGLSAGRVMDADPTPTFGPCSMQTPDFFSIPVSDVYAVLSVRVPYLGMPILLWSSVLNTGLLGGSIFIRILIACLTAFYETPMNLYEAIMTVMETGHLSLILYLTLTVFQGLHGCEG